MQAPRLVFCALSISSPAVQRIWAAVYVGAFHPDSNSPTGSIITAATTLDFFSHFPSQLSSIRFNLLFPIRSAMSLPALPTELILLISSYLYPADLNPLLRTCSSFHRTLTNLFYHLACKPRYEKAALYSSAATGNRALVSLIFKQNPDLTIFDEDIDYPIPSATPAEKKTDLALDLGVGLILRYPNKHRDLYGDGVSYAVATNRLALLKQLLSYHADPSCVTSSGQTPLHLAVMNRNPTAARLLLQYFANPDEKEFENPNLVSSAFGRGSTALHRAVSNNDLEMVKILLEGGASTEVSNMFGKTPWFSAVQIGVEVAEALRDAGADINARDHRGCTFWDYPMLHRVIQMLDDLSPSEGEERARRSSVRMEKLWMYRSMGA